MGPGYRQGALSKWVRRRSFRAVVAALAATAAFSVLTAVPAAAGSTIYLYWTNSATNTIGRANSNGTSVNQDFIDVGGVTQFGVWSVAVSGSYIYWTDFRDGTIGRANLNGTGVNKTFIKPSASDPASDVALGPSGSYIYWTNAVSPGIIARAKLNGTDINNSFINVSGNEAAELAASSSYIYWTDYNKGDIGRATPSGTGIMPAFISGASDPIEVVAH